MLNIVWNPDRNLFVLPYLNHPVTWYGFLFACGFLIGYFFVRKIFTEFLREEGKAEQTTQLEAIHATDRLAVLMVIGGILGARLGHVFFYGWSYYANNPKAILKIWEGGLASHGGAVGGLIALCIFVFISRKTEKKFTFLAVLDTIVIPTALLGACIRIGNFINQEITGIPTSLPWGIVFLHPIDGISGRAVHPVQLYESLGYFFIFLTLCLLWLSDKKSLGYGKISGWFFLLVFSFRFFIEYFKAPQNEYFDNNSWLTMGQVLSIPFIFLGFFLLLYYYLGHRKKSV